MSTAPASWQVTVAVGVSAALLVWLVLAGLVAVPGSARRRSGLRLPLWWRLLGPLAAAGAWYGRRWLGWRSRRGLDATLRNAGLLGELAPEQVFGTQLAAGLVATACVSGMALLMDASPWTLAAPALGAAAGGWALPRLWLADRIRARRRAIGRALPFVLDMTTLCVEGGLNLHGALQRAADKGPPGPLRDELLHLLGDVRAGMPRTDALRQLAQRVDLPAVRTWVTALIQAEALGMSLAPILRAQADQCRAERFLLAEKLALQAPVKMLLPLIVFIFPCTFIVIAFPIAMKLLALAA